MAKNINKDVNETFFYGIFKTKKRVFNPNQVKPKMGRSGMKKNIQL